MKALTLWQPWASLVAVGAKEYETRAWSTTYRGEVAIHAAKTREGLLHLPSDSYADLLTWDGRLHMPFGAIVCVVELMDVVPTCPLVNAIGDQERAFGDWRCGRFAWQLRMLEVLDRPIEWRGRQGLWNWIWE